MIEALTRPVYRAAARRFPVSAVIEQAFMHPNLDQELTPPNFVEVDALEVPDLGEITTWTTHADSPHWLVATHGAVGETANLVQTELFHHAGRMIGANVLSFAFRNAPGAPIPEDRITRFGQTETAEARAAIEHAKAQDAKGIVLGGVSTGAAIMLGARLERPDDEKIKGLIGVGALTDPMRTIEHGIREGAPHPALRPLARPVLHVISSLYGIDRAAIDYPTRMEREGYNTDTLLIHGTDDETVPYAHTVDLARQVDRVTAVPLHGHKHRTFERIEESGLYISIIAGTAETMLGLNQE